MYIMQTENENTIYNILDDCMDVELEVKKQSFYNRSNQDLQ